MNLLGLLIAMLAVGCVGGEKAVVRGALECDQPFYAQVTLWELDYGLHGGSDEFAEPLEFQPTTGQHKVNFVINGEESDPFWDRDGVEPRLVIKHTCGGGKHWICKDYGNFKGNFHLTEDVKLNDATDITLKKFYDCDAEYKFIAKPGISTMNLLVGLLMTMLAVDYVGGEKATVTVVLKCKHPFYAKVQLKEIDDGPYGADDEFAEPLEFKKKDGQTEVKFHFSGEASDFWWLDGAEPKLVIKYEYYGVPIWVCKEFGTIREDFQLNEIVELDNPDDMRMKGYYNCASSYHAPPGTSSPDKMA